MPPERRCEVRGNEEEFGRPLPPRVWGRPRTDSVVAPKGVEATWYGAAAKGRVTESELPCCVYSGQLLLGRVP